MTTAAAVPAPVRRVLPLLVRFEGLYLREYLGKRAASQPMLG